MGHHNSVPYEMVGSGCDGFIFSDLDMAHHPYTVWSPLTPMLMS